MTFWAVIKQQLLFIKSILGILQFLLIFDTTSSFRLFVIFILRPVSFNILTEQFQINVTIVFPNKAQQGINRLQIQKKTWR